MVRGLGLWYGRLILVGLSAAAVTAAIRSIWLWSDGSPITVSAIAIALYFTGGAAVIALTATGINRSDAQHHWNSVVTGRGQPRERRSDMEQRISFSWYAGAVAVVCLLAGALLD